MAGFDTLKALPPDALLGLMAAFQADPRPEKIDLGVGVYRDETGNTPIMTAVTKAEELLLSRETTKVYEGPRGNANFCAHIESTVFGSGNASLLERVTSLTTPGGCGALYLAAVFAKRISGNPSVWISAPSWPNHTAITRQAGLDVKDYPYAAPGRTQIDFDAMVAAFQTAKPGDLIILQGPCHNPTGIDLTLSQWRTLAALIERKGLIALIDIAYHGLGDGLEEDLKGVRAALATLPSALVSYSCSKNFGLYRERTGCLIALCETAKSAQIATTHLADIARASYSMPPAHGAAIVNTILSDTGLKKDWETELSDMRARIKHLRRAFANQLLQASDIDELVAIAGQKGMFSMLPLPSHAAADLAAKDGIYLPTSGRINLAGLGMHQIEFAATKLGLALQY
ncbi:MAG: amino acid aminotransferase [Pseudomonadota bacterium]